MSFDNAITQRSQMNAYYKQLIDTEPDPNRVEKIHEQIKLNNSEILELRKQQQKIFGKKEPLKQTETRIEMDPESRTQKITINGAAATAETTPKPTPIDTPKTTDTKNTKVIGNRLRDMFIQRNAENAEDNLKAKIAAAKAAKKPLD